MAEAAAWIYARSPIYDFLQILGHRFVVDIRDVDIERHRPRVLRIEGRSFDLGVGLRAAIAAKYADQVFIVLPMKYKDEIQQPRMYPFPFTGSEIATSP